MLQAFWEHLQHAIIYKMQAFWEHVATCYHYLESLLSGIATYYTIYKMQAFWEHLQHAITIYKMQAGNTCKCSQKACIL